MGPPSSLALSLGAARTSPALIWPAGPTVSLCQRRGHMTSAGPRDLYSKGPVLGAECSAVGSAVAVLKF